MHLPEHLFVFVNETYWWIWTIERRYWERHGTGESAIVWFITPQIRSDWRSHGVPALTRCHFNSRRRLHRNTDKRQNSSLCKGFRKLFTTAWREINVIRELHYNHTCFITAHSGSGNICELRALKPHEIKIRVLWLLVDGLFPPALRLFAWLCTTKVDNLCFNFFPYQIIYILILLYQ